VVDVEAGEALAFMREHVDSFANAYWGQLALGGLRRFFWRGGSDAHRAFRDLEAFSGYLRRKLKECFLYRRSPPEAHGSLEMVPAPKAPVDFYRKEAAKPLAWLGILDLDFRSQKVEPEEVRRRFAAAVEFLRGKGVEPEIHLSRDGYHAVFRLPPLEDPLAARTALAGFLSRRFELVFDTQPLEAEHHMVRLTFSWHPAGGLFCVPLHWWELEELNVEELRGLGRDPEEVEARLREYGGEWRPLGEIVEPEAFNALLTLLAAPEDAPSWSHKFGAPKRLKRVEGWRSLRAPDLGAVEYAGELEGFGWVRVLIERQVYPKDGKLNLAWLVLAPAVAKGILSETEAAEWLRRAAELCGKDPSPYLKKLEGEIRRRRGREPSSEELALPTWRSLLTRQRKDGRPLSGHYEKIRKPLLEALAEKGLVRLRAAGNAAQPASS
jgi:hypothetical protein